MKKLLILFPFLLLVLLVGCQNQQSSEKLHQDSERIYTSVKDEIQNGQHLTGDEWKELDKYKTTYIDHYKDYPSDETLISNMEGQVNSFKMYKVAIGLNKKDGENFYKSRLEKSISSLSSQFNK